MDELVKSVGKKKAIAIMILDAFEDVLDEHHILIPDEDRNGDATEACIYGMTYGNLEDEICTILNDFIQE